MEAPVDDKRNAMHDSRFLQGNEQQDQRQHVGGYDADQADQAIGYRAPDDPHRVFRLPVLCPAGETRGCP